MLNLLIDELTIDKQLEKSLTKVGEPFGHIVWTDSFRFNNSDSLKYLIDSLLRKITFFNNNSEFKQLSLDEANLFLTPHLKLIEEYLIYRINLSPDPFQPPFDKKIVYSNDLSELFLMISPLKD